jgi:kinetochore protein Mis12/MTW1
MNKEDGIELKTTRLLTEHFGYQPIAVIDDIINAINEIMYRCTEQLEQILINQKIAIDQERKKDIAEKKEREKNDDIIVDMNPSTIIDDENNKEKYTIQDIQVGTATLESYLEHNINKNFDKFEVYALRNVFTLPEDLVDGGFIRLKHHEGLFINSNINQTDRELTEKIINTIHKIKYQAELNKSLCDAVTKFHKLSRISKIIKSKLQPLLVTKDTDIDQNKLIAQITPINDTLLYLITQIRSMYNKINELKILIDDDTLRDKFLHRSKEEEELNTRIDKIIDKIIQKPTTESVLGDLSGIKGQELIDFFTKKNEA